jgi:hypothetical protein
MRPVGLALRAAHDARRARLPHGRATAAGRLRACTGGAAPRLPAVGRVLTAAHPMRALATLPRRDAQPRPRPPRAHALAEPRADFLRRRFWVLLRWKEDGATLLFGHAPHFQHELDHEEAEHGTSVLYKPGAKK